MRTELVSVEACLTLRTSLLCVAAHAGTNRLEKHMSTVSGLNDSQDHGLCIPNMAVVPYTSGLRLNPSKVSGHLADAL